MTKQADLRKATIFFTDKAWKALNKRKAQLQDGNKRTISMSATVNEVLENLK